MTRLRVAIVADYLEEGWPSMDLVADMLMERLRGEHADAIEPTLVRPPMRRRAGAIPGLRNAPAARTIDRLVNRLHDYPRLLSPMATKYDVFHLVDHSYSQLVHRLPAERTLVTCHDIDTFRSVLEPERERRSAPFRAMTRHILAGLRKAGHVACDTAATREALVRHRVVPADRTSIVHNGPHPSCGPHPEPAAEAEAARLLGARRELDVLHVGSTIPRKRVDVLLQVLAAVRATHPAVRLVRVGGPFTGEQRALVRDLGLQDAILTLPFLDRATLAAVYRRSTLLLLTSEREGFGLPVLEAQACGVPVVASDIAALREVGGTAATYCPPADVEAWRRAVVELLAERQANPPAWRARRDAGLARANAFSWTQYTAAVVSLYRRLAVATND